MVPTCFQATGMFIPRASRLNCYDYFNWYKKSRIVFVQGEKMTINCEVCHIFISGQACNFIFCLWFLKTLGFTSYHNKTTDLHLKTSFQVSVLLTIITFNSEGNNFNTL